MSDHLPDQAAIDAVVHARHGDPFALLGPHQTAYGTAIRTFIPDADSVDVVEAETGMVLGRLARMHEAGFWSGLIPHATAYRFRVTSGPGIWETEDAYSFPPLLGDIDIYLLGEGRHRDISQALGAHVVEINGVRGTRFAVWAPNARRVSVVGTFNQWLTGRG